MLVATLVASDPALEWSQLPLAGAPAALRVAELMSDPPLRMLEDFVSQEEAMELVQLCASSTRWEASTHLQAGAAVGAMRTSASCQLFYPLPDDLQNEELMRSALGSEARLLYRLTQRICGVSVLRSPHSLALGKLGDGLLFCSCVQ